MKETTTQPVARDANLWGDTVDDPGAWGATTKDDKHIDKTDTTPVDDAALWDGPQDDAALWGPAPDDPGAWGAPASSAAPVSSAAQDDGPPAELKVVRAGTLVPQSSIRELATRSVKWLDRTNVEDTYLQLFLTQTPAHLVAVHERGTFTRVDTQELAGSELEEVGASEGVRASLARFVKLLKEVQALVKMHGQVGHVSLVCERGKLELMGRLGTEGLLGEDELARFNPAAQKA